MKLSNMRLFQNKLHLFNFVFFLFMVYSSVLLAQERVQSSGDPLFLLMKRNCSSPKLQLQISKTADLTV